MYVEDLIIAPGIDVLEEIQRLKVERNAVIMAHYYQDPDIQDLADYLGDSLRLAQLATETDADVIVLCGVHFMAETAKILNPHRTVLIPDVEAGCSLADSCPPGRFKRFIADHPDHTVISYINTTAEVKALSDIICTSSNARRVIESIPADRKIIFAPDKHLGAYLVRQTGRQMVLWDGSCIVHDVFSEQEILRLKREHPGAVLLAHPECQETILRHADYIGSTTALIKFAETGDHSEYIVATEEGVIHQMKKLAPEKVFIPAPTIDDCNCSQCPYMRLHTLEKVYLALRDMTPEVTLPETLRLQALAPLKRMLSVG